MHSTRSPIRQRIQLASLAQYRQGISTPILRGEPAPVLHEPRQTFVTRRGATTVKWTTGDRMTKRPVSTSRVKSMEHSLNQWTSAVLDSYFSILEMAPPQETGMRMCSSRRGAVKRTWAVGS